MFKSLGLFTPSSSDAPKHPPLFPLYLLPPAVPWRWRSTSTAAAAASSSNPPQLNDCTQLLRCRTCGTDLCFASAIISKGFTGQHGRAYLLTTLETARVELGLSEARRLATGMHTVANIICRPCGRVIGWKYLDTAQERQRYKVGKYLLERERVVKVNVWEAGEETSVKRRKGGAPSGKLARGGGWEDRKNTWETAQEREVRRLLELPDVDLSDEEAREELFSGVSAGTP